jgi:hypothetical protein
MSAGVLWPVGEFDFEISSSFDLNLTPSSYFQAVAVTTACCSNQNLDLFIFFATHRHVHSDNDITSTTRYQRSL